MSLLLQGSSDVKNKSYFVDSPCAPLQGPDIAIHHPDDVLNGMNEWSQEHHDRSGLTQKCRDSVVSLQVCDSKFPGLAQASQLTAYQTAQGMFMGLLQSLRIRFTLRIQALGSQTSL